MLAVPLILVPFLPSIAQGDTGVRPFALDRATQASGPVVVTNVSTGVLWPTGQPADVKMSLHNGSGSTVLAQTWWLLGRPGDPSPWNDPVRKSDIISLSIGARQDQAVTASITDDAAPPPGFYTLSVWVHYFDSKSQVWVHSDGADMHTPIQVLPAPDGLNRATGRAVKAPLWIQQAFRDGAGRIHVVIANSSTLTKTVEVGVQPAGPRSCDGSDPVGDVITLRVTAAGGAETKLDIVTRTAPQYAISLDESSATGNALVDGGCLRPPLG